MKYCSNCGKPIKDTERVCPDCGQEVPISMIIEKETGEPSDREDGEETIADATETAPPVERKGMRISCAVAVILGVFSMVMAFTDDFSMMAMAAFCLPLAGMFYILSKTPKKSKYLLGTKTGIRKSMFVTFCVVLSFVLFMVLIDEYDESASDQTHQLETADKQQATDAFNKECERLRAEMKTLRTLIDECHELANSGEEPYDPGMKSDLETSANVAITRIRELPEIPSERKKIIAATKELEKISYESSITELSTKISEFKNAVKIKERITNPSEEYVLDVLKMVCGIRSCAAVTEENDPDGQLHKAVGCTSAVFFEYDEVDQTEVKGDTLLGKCTDAGGLIEIYDTVENAEKRNDYLKESDGTGDSSGSHTVLGTMVIRTSGQLTPMQQNELEYAIIQEFLMAR